MDVKLVLADNQAVFRAGFARFLVVEDGFRIVAQCDDVERLFKTAENVRDTVVAFAASLGADVPRLAAAAAAGRNRLLVILERGESPQAMIEQNVKGILYRDVNRDALLECVRTVNRGGQFVQSLPTKSAEQFQSDMVGERVRSRLSKKELQIISLLIRGYKNKEIARELNNTEQVIKNYLRSIFDKTGVSDRLELVLFTIHHKLLLDAVETAAPQRTQETVLEFSPTALLANLNGWNERTLYGSNAG